MSLILTMIMSMLGISSMRNTIIEEMMVSNSRDIALAFEAAEAGLREAEGWLELQDNKTNVINQPFVYPAGTAPNPALFEDGWWMKAEDVATYGLAGSARLDYLAQQPRFIMEFRGFIPDQETGIDDDSIHGNYVYSIIAQGTGNSPYAKCVLQSTVIKRYDLQQGSVRRQSWRQLR